jgi:hypothetical protein
MPKTTSISVTVEYDPETGTTPEEIAFTVRQALDEYFNRFDVSSWYEGNTPNVTEVKVG